MTANGTGVSGVTFFGAARRSDRVCIGVLVCANLRVCDQLWVVNAGILIDEPNGFKVKQTEHGLQLHLRRRKRHGGGRRIGRVVFAEIRRAAQIVAVRQCALRQRGNMFFRLRRGGYCAEVDTRCGAACSADPACISYTTTRAICDCFDFAGVVAVGDGACRLIAANAARVGVGSCIRTVITIIVF